MTGPSFAEVSAFVTVLEQTSFANAAKQLGLSAPRYRSALKESSVRCRSSRHRSHSGSS